MKISVSNEPDSSNLTSNKVCGNYFMPRVTHCGWELFKFLQIRMFLDESGGNFPVQRVLYIDTVLGTVAVKLSDFK